MVRRRARGCTRRERVVAGLGDAVRACRRTAPRTPPTRGRRSAAAGERPPSRPQRVSGRPRPVIREGKAAVNGPRRSKPGDVLPPPTGARRVRACAACRSTSAGAPSRSSATRSRPAPRRIPRRRIVAGRAALFGRGRRPVEFLGRRRMPETAHSLPARSRAGRSWPDASGRRSQCQPAIGSPRPSGTFLSHFARWRVLHSHTAALATMRSPAESGARGHRDGLPVWRQPARRALRRSDGSSPGQPGQLAKDPGEWAAAVSMLGAPIGSCAERDREHLVSSRPLRRARISLRLLNEEADWSGARRMRAWRRRARRGAAPACLVPATCRSTFRRPCVPDPHAAARTTICWCPDRARRHPVGSGAQMRPLVEVGSTCRLSAAAHRCLLQIRLLPILDSFSTDGRGASGDWQLSSVAARHLQPSSEVPGGTLCRRTTRRPQARPDASSRIGRKLFGRKAVTRDCRSRSKGVVALHFRGSFRCTAIRRSFAERPRDAAAAGWIAVRSSVRSFAVNGSENSPWRCHRPIVSA